MSFDSIAHAFGRDGWRPSIVVTAEDIAERRRLFDSSNTWQVQADSRAPSQVAVDLNEPAGHRNDLVDDRHAEPSSLGSFRAEGVSNMRSRVSVSMPTPVSLTSSTTKVLWRSELLAHGLFPELHGHDAAGRHRVAGVDDEIHDRAFELNGIDKDAADVRDASLKTYARSSCASEQW